MLAANAYNVPVPESPDDNDEAGDEEQPTGMDIDLESQTLQEDLNVGDLEDAAQLLDCLLDGDHLAEDACSDILRRITAEIEKERETLTNCRTAQLWLQYMRMVQILCRFIKAERTGNWDLHLSAVQEMLPYFAASGHNLYNKSAYVYLQNMICLEDDHPDVYTSFQKRASCDKEK